MSARHKVMCGYECYVSVKSMHVIQYKYYRYVAQVNTYVFVFNSSHRNQVTCSLLGGFTKPRAEVIQLLDSGLCSI